MSYETKTVRDGNLFPKKLPKITEAKFQSQVLQLAKLRGWKVCHFRPAQTARGWRTPMQGDPGFPDLVLARRGTVIFAELKRAGKVPTLDQQGWLNELSGSPKVYAEHWTPDHWPRIEQLLERA